MDGDDEASRAWLHRALLAGVVYEQAPESGTMEEYDRDSHTISLTLMGGIHFHSGAKSYADASPAALNTLSTLANAHKHLEPEGKKFWPKKGKVLRLAESTLRCAVKLLQEVIPSEPDAAGKRYCAGVRLTWLSHEQGAGRDTDDADDAAVAAPGAAAAPARAAGRGNAKKDNELITRLNKEGRKALLSVGLAKSFAEAEHLREECARLRKEYVKANARKGVAVATAESQHRIKEAHTIPEYRFAAFESMESFLVNAVQPYFSVPTGCGGALPDNDPGDAFLHLYPGCDMISRTNNVIAETIRLRQLAVSDYYLNGLSPMHPDNIFSLERATGYFMRGGNHDCAPESFRLDSYLPGAVGRNLRDAMAAPQRRADQAVVRPIADDDDVPAADEEEEEEAVEQASVDLRRFMFDNGQPYYHSVARPTYAFPRLTYQIIGMATYAEILTTVIPLPYAIGAELPEEAFAPIEDADAHRATIVLAQASTINLTLALKGAERLRLGEEAISEAQHGGPRMGDDGEMENTFSLHRRRLPVDMAERARVAQQSVEVQEIVNAREATQNAAQVLDRYRDMGIQVDNRRDRAAMAEEGVDAIPDNLVPVMQHHIKVVRKALAELATRFKRCQYAEMNAVTWTQVLEPGATDDHMPMLEFYPPRNVHDDSELTQMQRIMSIYRTTDGTAGFTAEEERAVIASVEIFPDWQIERSEPLAQRPRFQQSKAIMLQRQKKQIQSILEDPAFTEKEEARMDAKMQTVEKHAKEYDEWQTVAWKKCDEIYFSTERLSPAQKAVRDYTKKHIIPDRAKAVVKQRIIDTRSYAVTRQFYTDTYRSCELATKTNAPYMEKVHTCAHHSFRYLSRRDDPALNYTMYGPSGAGKSHALLVCVKLMPNGVVSDTTSETTQAYNIDQDIDGHVVVYQEMSSDLLFAQRNKNDQGASDRINFAKARLTSFVTQTKYFKQNEQTGKREAEFCFSSQHIVTLGATNQELGSMDKNMRRRLLIDVYAESPIESEGGHPGQMNQPKDEERSASLNVAEQTRAEHRELFSAYAYIENAIKMGAIDDVMDTKAHAFLEWILLNAVDTIGGAIYNKGAKNWIIEAARVLAIQHLCYKALFSPTAFYLHENTHIKRWTPAGFQYFAQPHMFSSKDAIIHAFTMLDFLYTSQNEERLLATIALNVLHVDEPSRWRLRKRIGNTHQEPQEDPNYLSFTAHSVPLIGTIISDQHKHVAKLRGEDIRSMIQKYEYQKRSSLGFDEPERDDQNKIARPVRLTGHGIPEERPALIYEHDPSSMAKKPPMQFAMSIEFLENRFGFSVTENTPAEIRYKIEHREMRVDADLFREEDPRAAIEALRELVECHDTRAPLVASIRKALNMPTLEKSPYEHDELLPVPPAVFKYWTFYLPEDVFVRFPHTEIRVPVDGVGTFLEGKRDPEGSYLMQENFTKPMPTARTSMYNIAAGAVEKMPGPEMSRGTIFDRYDFDYYSADASMRRQGHPGIPQLHNIYIESCIHYRDHDAYPDPEAYREALFDAIPQLDPAAGVPLPFAFGPIEYAIERYLAEVVYQWPQEENYPMCNAFDRIIDTVKRTDGKMSNNANGAFEQMSKRYDFDERWAYAERKRKRALAPPMATPRREEEEEEVQQVNKRRRLDKSGPRDRSPPDAVEEEEEEEIDAMDIDEPVVPAAARMISRHLAARPVAAESPSIYQDSEDHDLEEIFT
jgi:hypothetical protein